MTCSSLILPPKTLAVINVHVDLKRNSTKDTYEVKPVFSWMNTLIW